MIGLHDGFHFSFEDPYEIEMSVPTCGQNSLPLLLHSRGNIANFWSGTHENPVQHYIGVVPLRHVLDRPKEQPGMYLQRWGTPRHPLVLWCALFDCEAIGNT